MDSLSFDLFAQNYEDIRPGYPDEMYVDIKNLTQIPQKGYILEIGSGTGQATLPFAKQGYLITCLEPGRNLLQIAEQKMKTYSNVTFLNSTFEVSTIKKNFYDLIISATAFHWVDQKIGYQKSFDSLKLDGKIAFFWNKHPEPYTGFHEKVQEIYRKIVPEWPDPNTKQRTNDWINETEKKIVESDLFNILKIKKYYWFRNYTSKDYIKLLSTYSDHISLEEHRRTRLFNEIKAFIDNDFNGIVKRPYLTVLFIAKKIT